MMKVSSTSWMGPANWGARREELDLLIEAELLGDAVDVTGLEVGAAET
ncbi:hypothetical protein [Nocardia wallacei]|nr:hypothetical protein [Nocardia wallacei]